MSLLILPMLKKSLPKALKVDDKTIEANIDLFFKLKALGIHVSADPDALKDCLKTYTDWQSYLQKNMAKYHT